MGAFYRKFRRIFFALIFVNVAISLLQICFAWNHMVKHEWWLMGLSIFLATINAWCAVSQYRNWRRVQQEEKDYMWQTLSNKTLTT